MLPEITKGVSNAKLFEIGIISRGSFGKGVGWGDESYNAVLQHIW